MKVFRPETFLFKEIITFGKKKWQKKSFTPFLSHLTLSKLYNLTPTFSINYKYPFYLKNQNKIFRKKTPSLMETSIQATIKLNKTKYQTPKSKIKNSSENSTLNRLLKEQNLKGATPKFRFMNLNTKNALLLSKSPSKILLNTLTSKITTPSQLTPNISKGKFTSLYPNFYDVLI